MLHDVVAGLRCPHCGADLAVDTTAGTLRCAAGRHTFDIARQGYANLLAGDAKAGTADTAAMVAARDAFLGAGHYRPIADALAEEAAHLTVPDAPSPPGRRSPGDTVTTETTETTPQGLVVDVGAGTGHYLARVLDALPGRAGLALDISKFALRRAAKAHPRAGAVVCDAWRPLPVRDQAAALVLNVFAPRNPPELRRVLASGGILAVVTPNVGHLAELVEALDLLRVDADKKSRLDTALDPYFTPVRARRVAFRMTLGHADVDTVVGMGPSAWHTDTESLRAAIAALPDPVDVGADVTVSAYAPRP